LVDVHEIWLEDDAIRGDLDAIISNPIASTILKCFEIHIYNFQPCSAMGWDYTPVNQGMYFTNGSEIILN
jgi:hypothetical protein